MEKLIRDGNVAVLISPGFGAGWSTWNENTPDLLFDPEIAELVAAGDKAGASKLASEKYPDACLLGSDDLVVRWVPQGSRFTVGEYDGSESLMIIDPDFGFVA
jgi:hypothetical protein